jgi:two-component system, NtrC family, sensor kinase
MKSNPTEIERKLDAGVRGPDSCRPAKIVSIDEEPNEFEDEYRQIFDTIDAIIVRLDNHGKISEINSKVEQIFGYKRKDLLGKHYTKFGILTIKDLPSMIKLFDDALMGRRTTYHDELEARDKAGNKIFIDVNCTVIKKDGKIDGALCIVSDITERKKTEEALRLSEETFSKAFHTSPNPLCIISVEEETFIDINESFSRFTGYSREETIGRSSKELNLWVNEVESNLMRGILSQKGNMPNRQFTSRRKSGEMRIGLFSAETVNISGKQCRLLAINDITEQNWAEDTLKENEEFTSNLLINTPNPLFVAYPDSAIKYVNPAFEKLTGFNLSEIIGKKIPYPWWPLETKDEIWDVLKEINFSNGIKKEMAYQKKNGERLWVELNATMINKNGKRQYLLVNWVDITERKKAEEALKESEEKFAKAFMTSANAICISSLKDNKFVEVNDSYCRFTGYTRKEALGHTAIDLNLWVDEEELNKDTEAIQIKARVYNREFKSRCKSGEIRTGLGSAEIINIGGVPCRISVITDITERKKAEEALRESEEKFSKAFLASPGAIAISSIKDGRFIDVNEVFSEITGYTRAEAIGHTLTGLKIWTDTKSGEEFLQDFEKETHIHNKLVKFRRKSGEIGTGIFSAEKIVINNEPCIISINMDVTQQKKTEESLRLLGSVTQQVSDSIVVINPEFKITCMNKAAQNLFGYSIDEVLGADIELFDVTPVSRKIRREVANTISMGKTWTAEVTKRRKDGSTFLCHCRRSPLFGEDGQLLSYVVVYHDITEQKEIEARLQAQKKMVESILTSMPEGVLVTDSSDRLILANESFRRIFQTGRKVIDGKLLNEVLHVGQLFDLYSSIKTGNNDIHSLEFRYKVRSQEKIITCAIIKMDTERMLLIFSDVSREREEEDKLYLMDRLASLGEMAAGLAHELNNPLTGILTLSQLLVNSDLRGEQKEDLECIYSEARRAANIVKNVLLFTRNNSYENGKSSVNEVVKEVLRLREHEEKVKNINVVTNFQDNLPEIPLDKYQLQQVFLNIILNAEAAIEETKKPGTLTVTTERANNHINIMFTDTGCGIKKQILPRIFDPFFTTKEIGKGTGLGLSICYGIIVKHNGKINVKTNVGKGTTFTIKMPIANQ